MFGLLKYFNQNNVLLQILSYAKNLSGKGLLDCIDFDLSSYRDELIFWGQISHYGEPDLIIRFRKPGKRDLILCLEVKYYHYKSGGEGENDQLKRYFEGMTEFASLSESTFLGVIYLTKYPSRSELNESLKYIKKKGIIDADDKLFQLRWFEITEAIDKFDISSLSAGERLILKDLFEYLNYKNLVSFSKFSFQSLPFSLKPDHFYASTNFREFTFQKIDFEDFLKDNILTEAPNERQNEKPGKGV